MFRAIWPWVYVVGYGHAWCRMNGQVSTLLCEGEIERVIRGIFRPIQVRVQHLLSCILVSGWKSVAGSYPPTRPPHGGPDP